MLTLLLGPPLFGVRFGAGSGQQAAILAEKRGQAANWPLYSRSFQCSFEQAAAAAAAIGILTLCVIDWPKSRASHHQTNVRRPN